MSNENPDSLLLDLPAGATLDQKLNRLEVRLVLLHSKQSEEIMTIHRDIAGLRQEMGTAVAHLSELNRSSRQNALAMGEFAETAKAEAEHRKQLEIEAKRAAAEREQREAEERSKKLEQEATEKAEAAEREAEEQRRKAEEASKWWTWIRATLDKPLGILLLGVAMFSMGRCNVGPEDLLPSQEDVPDALEDPSH